VSSSSTLSRARSIEILHLTNLFPRFADWVLAHFLKGFALGTYALPSPITVVSDDDPKESVVGEERKALSLDAIAAFQEVLDVSLLLSHFPFSSCFVQTDLFCLVSQNGSKIVLDHWLLFSTHFEMGSIYERREEWAKAEAHYMTVMHGELLNSLQLTSYFYPSNLLRRVARAFSTGKPPELNPHYKPVSLYVFLCSF